MPNPKESSNSSINQEEKLDRILEVLSTVKDRLDIVEERTDKIEDIGGQLEGVVQKVAGLENSRPRTNQHYFDKPPQPQRNPIGDYSPRRPFTSPQEDLFNARHARPAYTAPDIGATGGASPPPPPPPQFRRQRLCCGNSERF